MAGTRGPGSEPQPPRKPLGAIATLVRLGLIGGVMAVLAVGFAYAGGWLSPGRLTQGSIMQAFYRAGGGEHAGFRRNHAKGLCVAGTFESNGKAQEISKAALFAPGKVRLLGRLSLAGPVPAQPDKPDTARALALQFLPDHGEEWRTAMIAVPLFPVSDVKGFTALLAATTPDPATGKPDPAKLQAFFKAYPESQAALGWIKAHPNPGSTFADSAYFGLNAFFFVAADGKRTPVRWKLVPLDPPVQPAEAGGADPNYLFDGVVARLKARPISWRLMLVQGTDGDPTADAAKPWPEERPALDAGTITLDQASGEDGGACTSVNFDPLVLPDGIEASADPILPARSAAYSRSFTLRTGEQKPPSQIAPGSITSQAGGQP